MAVQTEDKKLNGAGLTTLWGIIKQFFSSKQDKVSPLGSATKPVYISGDGTFGECDSYKDSTAKNVVGEFSDTNAEFAYRPTAGAVDIESGQADYGGHLETIKGNTVAWNQLVKNGDFSGGSNSWRASIYSSISIENGECTIVSTGISMGLRQDMSVPTISGHKYFFSFYAKGKDGGEDILASVQASGVVITNRATTSYVKYAVIGAANSSRNIFDISTTNATIYVKVINFIDLTLIYGAGNEPATVEQFDADYQKWFGKPLTYEDYDAGSLRPVKMTGIKTVGFNLCDEVWEKGYYTSDGLHPNGSGYTTKNPIKVLPNTLYHVKTSFYNNSSANSVVYYDSSMNYISDQTVGRQESYFATPANASYIRFNTGAEAPTGKVNINLHHSGDRDGEYEPYWESVLNVPITSLKGKLNGAGSSVVVFPDGMKKAGSVYDEIVRRGDKTYAIKRVKSVDMGKIDWLYGSSLLDFNKNISDCKSGNATVPLFLNTAIYIPILRGSFNTTSIDKVITIDNGSKNVRIRNLNYNDAATFKTAMSGVYLYYELETPQEYLLDDFELPQSYDVDDYGTEEILLGENGCAPILDLKYGINAGDTIKNLPHNYVSINRQNFSEGQQAIARQNIGAASISDIAFVQKQIDALSKITQGDLWIDMGLPSGILWAKRNIDLSQANGFTASEYQYDCSFFSWGNTDGHNPNAQNTFDYDFSQNNYNNTPGATLTGDITPSFDAAHVNIGTPWRMPTKDDFAELLNSAYTKFIDASGNDIEPSTTNKLITMNGVVGIRLKSLINGNTIFFACTGNAFGSTLYERGTNGYYWASSFNTSASAYRMYLDNSGVYPTYTYTRYGGFPIRPVM